MPVMPVTGIRSGLPFALARNKVAMPVVVVITHRDRPLAFIEFVDEAKYCRDTP